MDVAIVILPSVRIAYLRKLGPYGPELGQFWNTTFRPWLAAHGLLGEPCYGIALDDPDRTAPADCRYDAAVALPEGVAAPADAQVAMLPGGTHAVARYTGTAADIGAAWDWLLGQWLPASGHRPDARPCLEIYPRNWAVGADGAFSCELAVPVMADALSDAASPACP
jgi:AraC family transcriptional regulator